MTAKPMTARERRLVAILLLVAMCAFLWLGVVAPVMHGFAARADERARLAQSYANNVRLIDRIGALRATAEQQRMRARDYAIRAGQPDAAGEMLRKRLSDAITRSGGQLRLVQGTVAPAGWVRAVAQAQMSHTQLIALLDTLGTTPPYIVFETLDIAADRAVVSGTLDLMDVKIEISAPYAVGPAR